MTKTITLTSDAQNINSEIVGDNTIVTYDSVICKRNNCLWEIIGKWTIESINLNEVTLCKQ